MKTEQQQQKPQHLCLHSNLRGAEIANPRKSGSKPNRVATAGVYIQAALQGQNPTA